MIAKLNLLSQVLILSHRYINRTNLQYQVTRSSCVIKDFPSGIYSVTDYSLLHLSGEDKICNTFLCLHSFLNDNHINKSAMRVTDIIRNRTKLTWSKCRILTS